MRNIILTKIFLLAFIGSLYSQRARIGLIGGPAFSTNTRTNITIQNRRDSSDANTLAVYGAFSFFAGVNASIPLSKNLIFKPQLQYTYKGWKDRIIYTEINKEYNNNTIVNSIDLPLNLAFAIPTPSGRFILGLGPSFSFAISGKEKNEQDNMNHKIVFNSEDSNYSANRFDVGINLIAGYEFQNGVTLNLTYFHGFRDFRNFQEDLSPVNKMIVVGFGIGYYF